MFDKYNSNRTIKYATREERNIAVSEIISDILPDSGNILNIGSGGQEFLKQSIPNYQIFDIDICGKADLIVDIETIDKFDFEDNEFDVVVALDLLEHIENFHSIIKEAYRCSRRFVVFSLPNPGTIFLRMIFNKRRREHEKQLRGVYDKFYGLPLEKPLDRHKWYFSIDDVRELFEDHYEKEVVTSIEYFSSHQWNLHRRLLRFLLGERLYTNLFLPNIWLLIEVNANLEA